MSLFFKLFNFQDFYEDRSRWILWMPVFLGIGIGIYFGLPEEPNLWWGFGFLTFFGGLTYVLGGGLLKLIPLSLVFVSLGFSVANLRTHWLDTRMLNYPLPPLWIEGVVESAELKASKTEKLAQRFILTNLYAPEFEELPQKARLTYKGKGDMVKPGTRIKVYAKLIPVQPPVSPMGYDFRRQAYFQGIGATGFVLKAPKILGRPTYSSW